VAVFHRANHREQIILGTSPFELGTPVSIGGRDVALTLLRELGADPCGRATLRRLYGEVVARTAVCSVTDQQVADRLARWMVTGQIKVLRVPLSDLTVPIGSLLSVDAAPADAAPAPAKPTWVELQVLFADSGHPVPGIKLKIKPPGGDADEHTTDSNGLVRVDGIKKAGSCDVTSDIQKVRRDSALVVAGKPPASPIGDKPKRASYQLITVNTYKVKTGDTLDTLAKKVGLTEKDLALFNWGTDDPRQLNVHLRWDVGCTKRRGDKYVFDDTDDPGLIILPEPAELSAATGVRLVVGVEKVPPIRGWIFSL
jgi:hypothetical protein